VLERPQFILHRLAALDLVRECRVSRTEFLLSRLLLLPGGRDPRREMQAGGRELLSQFDGSRAARLA
jgi:hypothetical protein